MTKPLFSNRDPKALILPLVVEQILSMPVGMDWLARSVAFWLRYRSGK